MATIYQPADKDCWFQENQPTANNNLADLRVFPGDESNYRSIIYFDLSGQPGDSSNVGLAELSLYYHNYFTNDPSGDTVAVCELDNNIWVESEAAWNVYSTGNSWTTAGGDFNTDNKATTTMPASYGWVTWDITDLVKNAMVNENDNLNLIVKYDIEDTGNGHPQFYSSDETTETTKRPKLEITYQHNASVSDSMSMSDSTTIKTTVPLSESISLTDRQATKRTANYQTKNTATWDYQDKS